MGNDLTYGVKLTADGKQLVGEVKSARDEMVNLKKATDDLTLSARQLAEGQMGMSISESNAKDKAWLLANGYKETDGQLVKLSKTTKDASLVNAGATRELMVLGHEAMTGNFSRVPGTLLVLANRSGLAASGMLGLGLAIGTPLIALGALAMAIHEGRKEMEAMDNALVLTSGYAGLTRGGMESLAASMAASGQMTIGTSTEIVTALVASGRIGSEAIGAVARLTGDFARAAGQDIEKIAPQMIRLFSDPLKGAEELNKSMHFLTAADIEHIATLQQLGETQQAQLYLADKVAKHMPKEAENVGMLTKYYRELTGVVSGVVNAVMGLGKTDSIEAQVSKAREHLLTLNTFGGSQENIKIAEAELAGLLEKLAAKQKIAAVDAAAAAANEKDLAITNEIHKAKSYKIKELEDTLKLLASGQQTNLVLEREKEIREQIAKLKEVKPPPKAHEFDPEGNFWFAVEEARRKNSKKANEDYYSAYTSAVDEANRVVDKARTASGEYVNQLEFENSLIGKSAIDVQLLTDKRRIDLQLEKELLALRNDSHFKTRDSNPDVEAQYQRAIAGAQAAAEAAKAGAETEIKARDAVNRAWDTGGARAISAYTDEATNAAKQSERVFTDAFRAMDEAGVQFVRHQKVNWSSLIDGMINDLIRMQWQQSVTMPLVGTAGSPGLLTQGLSMFAGALGFGGSKPGGLAGMDQSMPIMSYAVGTDYVPYDMVAQIHKGERIVPAAQNSGSGGVTVNIIESSSKAGQVQQSSSNGVNVIDVFVSQVKSAIASDIVRGSGAVPDALSRTYGMNRTAGAY